METIHNTNESELYRLLERIGFNTRLNQFFYWQSTLSLDSDSKLSPSTLQHVRDGEQINITAFLNAKSDDFTAIFSLFYHLDGQFDEGMLVPQLKLQLAPTLNLKLARKDQMYIIKNEKHAQVILENYLRNIPDWQSCQPTTITEDELHLLLPEAEEEEEEEYRFLPLLINVILPDMKANSKKALQNIVNEMWHIPVEALQSIRKELERLRQELGPAWSDPKVPMPFKHDRISAKKLRQMIDWMDHVSTEHLAIRDNAPKIFKHKVLKESAYSTNVYWEMLISPIDRPDVMRKAILPGSFSLAFIEALIESTLSFGKPSYKSLNAKKLMRLNKGKQLSKPAFAALEADKERGPDEAPKEGTIYHFRSKKFDYYALDLVDKGMELPPPLFIASAGFTDRPTYKASSGQEPVFLDLVSVNEQLAQLWESDI